MAEVVDLLNAGISAARAGNRQQARELLTQVVQDDRSNEQGWLWLSSVLDSTDDVITCLNNVLTINPHNQWAFEALEVIKLRKLLEGSGAQMPTSSLQTPQTARKLGDFLVAAGAIRSDQLQRALDEQNRQRASGKPAPLGQILLRLGFIKRDQLAQALESQFAGGAGALGRGSIGQLGEYLIRKGHMNWSQLAQMIALQADLAQQGRAKRLGDLLVENHILSRDQLARVLEEQFHDYNAQYNRD